MVVARRALLVTVVRMKPQFRMRPNCQVVACVVLSRMMPLARYARLRMIALPNPGIEGLLAFLQVVASRL